MKSIFYAIVLSSLMVATAQADNSQTMKSSSCDFIFYGRGLDASFLSRAEKISFKQFAATRGYNYKTDRREVTHGGLYLDLSEVKVESSKVTKIETDSINLGFPLNLAYPKSVTYDDYKKVSYVGKVIVQQMLNQGANNGDLIDIGVVDINVSTGGGTAEKRFTDILLALPKCQEVSN